MNISFMICLLVLSTSEPSRCGAPAYMGETQASVWRKAQDYGMSVEDAELLVGDIWRSATVIHASGLHEHWREQKVDLVPFLVELLEEDGFPRGPRPSSREFSEIDVMRYLARFRDARGNAFLVKRVNKTLQEAVRTEQAVDFLCDLLVVLGTSQGENGLDILFRVQSEEFWKSNEAPEVEAKAIAGVLSKERRRESMIRRIRTSAIDALAISGTQRAVHAFGTGEGISTCFEDSLNEYFRMAVRYYVGVFKSPEHYGNPLPPEKIEQIEAIYQKYGKTYTPEVPDRDEHPSTTPHVRLSTP